MIEKYDAVKRIPSFDVDMSSTLKPVSFLNYAQEAANIHADYIGVGYDSMQVTRKGWVLARMHVKFHRLPMWRDIINVLSWHKGAAGFQFLREFEVYDNDSREKLISATTSWLVIDIDTRRLSKFPELVESEDKCIKEDAIAEQAPKIVMPKECEPVCVAVRDVAYSDLDMLGHVNNVKYTEWSMNAIELDITANRRLKELVINFNNEVKPGDQVELYRHMENGEDGSLVFYIEGRVNGKSSFIEKLVF
jgi:acyl-ACP thioesterase